MALLAAQPRGSESTGGGLELLHRGVRGGWVPAQQPARGGWVQCAATSRFSVSRTLGILVGGRDARVAGRADVLERRRRPWTTNASDSALSTAATTSAQATIMYSRRPIARERSERRDFAPRKGLSRTHSRSPALPQRPERGVGPASATEAPRARGVLSASAEDRGRGGGSGATRGGCYKMTRV